MRIYEISGGMRIIVSSYENELLTLAEKNPLRESELEPFELELARKMVSRGILVEETDNESIFKPNKLANIWRL